MGEGFPGLGDGEEAVLAVPRQVWSLLPERLVRARGVFAVALEGGPANPCLVVAMADPSDLALADELRFATGLRVRPVAASPSALRRLVALHLGGPPLAAQARQAAADGRTPGPAAIELPEERGPALRREDWIVPLAPGETKWK